MHAVQEHTFYELLDKFFINVMLIVICPNKTHYILRKIGNNVKIIKK